MNQKLALIIEDDDDLANIFTEALKAAGFNTETIQAGDVALERLGKSTPDVVVLDLHLPQVEGRQILEWISGEPRLAETRIIVTSADAQQAEYLRKDADLVLVKPVSFAQLRDLAARLSSSKRRTTLRGG